MTFDAAAFVSETLAQNRLTDIADYLDAHPEEAVYYADRHVGDEPVGEERRVACEAALALAEQWRLDRPLLIARGYRVSVPVTYIDDDWLDDAIAARKFPVLGGPTPPHVWICVARTDEAYSTDDPLVGEPYERSGHAEIDGLLRDGVALVRLLSDDEDCPNAWALRFTASAKQ